MDLVSMRVNRFIAISVILAHILANISREGTGCIRDIHVFRHQQVEQTVSQFVTQLVVAKTCFPAGNQTVTDEGGTDLVFCQAAGGYQLGQIHFDLWLKAGITEHLMATVMQVVPGF